MDEALLCQLPMGACSGDLTGGASARRRGPAQHGRTSSRTRVLTLTGELRRFCFEARPPRRHQGRGKCFAGLFGCGAVLGASVAGRASLVWCGAGPSRGGDAGLSGVGRGGPFCRRAPGSLAERRTAAATGSPESQPWGGGALLLLGAPRAPGFRFCYPVRSEPCSLLCKIRPLGRQVTRREQVLRYRWHLWVLSLLRVTQPGQKQCLSTHVDPGSAPSESPPPFHLGASFVVEPPGTAPGSAVPIAHRNLSP